MRGTGEPCGVGVKDGTGVGSTDGVGEGRLVGVGSLREQATSATRIKKRQKYRFIKVLLRLQAFKCARPCIYDQCEHLPPVLDRRGLLLGFALCPVPGLAPKPFISGKG